MDHIESTELTNRETWSLHANGFKVVLTNMGSVDLTIHNDKGSEVTLHPDIPLHLNVTDSRESLVNTSSELLGSYRWFVFAPKGGRLKVEATERNGDQYNRGIVHVKYYQFIPMEAMVAEIKETVKREIIGKGLRMLEA